MAQPGAVHPDVYSRWSKDPGGGGVEATATTVEPKVKDPAVQTRGRVARVLIADDQTLFRSGLARLLDEDPRVEVVGQAFDGLEVVKQAAALKPDVVLMDIKMPNLDGIEATRRITAEHPEIRILVLTTFDADSFVLQALRAGASGYVLKDSQPDAIVSSIVAVLSGERVMASAVANRVLDMLTGSTPPT